MRIARFPASAIKVAMIAVLGAALLSGCSWFNEKKKLPGERIDIRPQTDEAAPLTPKQSPLPNVYSNADWTQTNGAPTHNSGNLAGPATLTRVWSADAGSGNNGSGAITSAPIVVGGTVFTLDSTARLTAFDASSGRRIWRTDLAPKGQNDVDGFGGGLAADGGKLFVTDGFGEVLAVEPGTGKILWRQSFGAPIRSAPAAANGLVVAVTRDNTGYGLNAEDGKLRWRVRGAASAAAYLGGASPAIVGPLAVIPFASGELIAVEAQTGRQFWSAVLSGGRRGLASSAITDVSGDPVVIGPYVIAANQSGRMIAVDARVGQRAWTRNVGSTGPIWGAGDTLFVVSDQAKLMRISARDGSTLWETQLKAFGSPDSREDAITYSGPVLVDGHLLFTDSTGNLFSYDAETGEGKAVAQVSGGSITGPVVAGGEVYVLSDNGTLYAYH